MMKSNSLALGIDMVIW